MSSAFPIAVTGICLGLLWLAGCGPPAPQTSDAPQDVAPATENQQSAASDSADHWTPPPAADFLPGSLQLVLSGAVETELRLPVLATYDPNSDFARFSLDSSEGAPVNFSLVITGWSALREEGSQQFHWSGALVEEGNPQVEALLFLDYQDETWRAEELAVTLNLRAEQVSGTITEAVMRASEHGPMVRISGGAFDTPLRRLPLLEMEQEIANDS